MASIYDFKVKKRDGAELDLADLKGKVLLIVNTATGCGFTPQYEGLEKMYEKEKFHILSKEEYIDIVINQLELLRPEIVIHRITGDPDPNELIEPTWLIKKFCVLNDIDKEMVKRDIYQGDKTT